MEIHRSKLVDLWSNSKDCFFYKNTLLFFTIFLNMTQVQNSLANNIYMNSYKHRSEEMSTDHLGSSCHILNKFTNRKQQFLFLKDSVQMNQDQCRICAHCLESLSFLSPLSRIAIVSEHTALNQSVTHQSRISVISRHTVLN